MKEKEKNEQPVNLCLIRGRILEKTRLEGIDGANDTYLLVETALPEGSKALIPCAVAHEVMRKVKGRLKKGAWIRLIGVPDGAMPDEEEGAVVCWVEVLEAQVLSSDADKTYCNRAEVYGVMTESGCMVDGSGISEADFVLESESVFTERPFEMVGIVPAGTVDQFVKALGSKTVRVRGALEFLLAEDTGLKGITALIHTEQIDGLGTKGKAAMTNDC